MSENNFSQNEIAKFSKPAQIIVPRQELIRSSMRKSSVLQKEESAQKKQAITHEIVLNFYKFAQEPYHSLFHSLKTIVDVETMAIKPFSTTAERKN